MPGKDNQEHEHKLAYVKWYQKHVHEDWYGSSAVVCNNTINPDSPCSFIPIQRTHSVSAYSILNIEIAGVSETVFIAKPIATKFCLN